MTEPITKEERKICRKHFMPGVMREGPSGERLSGSVLQAYEAALTASEARVKALEDALNERDLFINPATLELYADEIDCGPSCEFLWASGRCCKTDRKDIGYCPNDVAATLRAVAKVARADLLKQGEKETKE